MREKTLYFLFTDTGTYLSKAINYCTKQSLNHVSIGFDPELKEVYSFGRTHPRNPFNGGFVKEDIRSDFLKDANCAVYTYRFTEEEWDSILRNIKEIEAQKASYKYNFIGLIGILLQIKINRKNKLFCSQFVATVLRDAASLELNKPDCFITPADIRDQTGMQLMYQGKLRNYHPEFRLTDRELADQQAVKQSLLFLLSQKMKQFVIK